MGSATSKPVPNPLPGAEPGDLTGAEPTHRTTPRADAAPSHDAVTATVLGPHAHTAALAAALAVAPVPGSAAGTETPEPNAGTAAERPQLELPLHTERLVLRTHTTADVDWLLPVYSSAAVARYLLDPPWTMEVAIAKVAERLEKTGLHTPSGALALVIDYRGEPVGDIVLWYTDAHRKVAEIGWVLDPAHSGKGFAAEAVCHLLGIAFSTYHLHRVVAQMDARNTASARLASRVGMKLEAHLRQDWWSKGEWTDTLVFGMLATDPRMHPGTQ